MDKYEYKLKLQQIKNQIEAKDYTTAAQIADSINWRKVKSVATLCMIGELYEKTKHYEESREILLLAYDRSPVGRNIIFRLTKIAIKMGNLAEAQEYYEEFIQIAPHDNMKYVLKYEIARAKNSGIEELISILEEFKDREYTEEWAFELAYLYHKSGKAEKCVDICDELILWFGEGKYVEKALELKMLYQPLNKLQEDKYRRVKQKHEGVVEVSPYEELLSGEIVRETVKIPKIHEDAGKFNTQNLQAELAKSMRQIMEATKQETVKDTMKSIKKMVGDVSYFQAPEPEEPQEPQEQMQHEEVQQDEKHLEEPKQTPVAEETPETSLDIDFKGMLSEEYDGQLSMKVPEAPKPNLQITGQMSIEDILAEWEKTKAAARVAIEAAEQRRLETVKAKALQEAESIMERLVAETGLEEWSLMSAKEAEEAEQQSVQETEVEYEAEKSQGEEIEPFFKKEKPFFSEEPAVPAEEEMSYQEEESYEEGTYEEGAYEEEESYEEGSYEEEGTYEEGAYEEEESYEEGSYEEGSYEEEESYEEGSYEEEESYEEGTYEEEESYEEGAYEEEEFYEEGSYEEEESYEDENSYEEGYSYDEADAEEDNYEEHNYEEEILRRQEMEQQLLEQEIRKERMYQQEITVEETMQDEQPITKLSEELRQIFTYFTLIDGMERQLCQALEGARQRRKGSITSVSGNVLIIGGSGSGKTVLATDFIKALRKVTGKKGGKVGKISGSILNQKDIGALFRAVDGGCLIIESAGDLSSESVTRLSALMEQKTNDLMVILEDDRAGIEKVMNRDVMFSKKFTEKITIPIFTSDELVGFAKAYAREYDCEIEDMGVLALYNSISNIERLDKATTLTEVKEIMDDAILRANRGGWKKIFGGKRSNEEGYTLIKERDFRN